MVSAADRQRFRRPAEIETELNRQSVLESAARPPGESIALGLALSEFAAAFGGKLSRPDDVSPARLWRKRTTPGQGSR